MGGAEASLESSLSRGGTQASDGHLAHAQAVRNAIGTSGSDDRRHEDRYGREACQSKGDAEKHGTDGGDGQLDGPFDAGDPMDDRRSETAGCVESPLEKPAGTSTRTCVYGSPWRRFPLRPRAADQISKLRVA